MKLNADTLASRLSYAFSNLSSLPDIYLTVHSYHPDVLASNIRNLYDSGDVADDKDARWAKDSKNDRQSLRSGHRAHRCRLQLITDMREFDIPIS